MAGRHPQGLAWANTTSGGVGIFLGSQDAMSQVTELFKLALIQIAITPNPFVGQAPHFRQVLDMGTGAVVVELGAARIEVWIDANTDILRITAEAPTLFSISATASSTRPSTAPWGHSARSTCNVSHSKPDVYLSPIPAGVFSFDHPGPNRQQFKHASADRRPLRTLDRRLLPQSGGFAPATIIAFHRNDASEGESLADLFRWQGIESLVATTPDHWMDRQSGFALEAEPGTAALRRVDPHTLVSTAPGTSFALRATVLAVQTDSEAEWLADLAALIAATPTAVPARAAHDAWWAGFWNRSHIAINTTRWPPASSRGSNSSCPPGPQPPGPPPLPPPPPAAALPVPGAAMWLRAASLSLTAAGPRRNGSAVAVWGTVAQINTTLQPKFIVDAFGPGSAGIRFDGEKTFLTNSTAALPGGDLGSTHFAVFRDTGSKGTCCNGIVHWSADIGIATVKVLDQYVAEADGPGVDVTGSANVLNRLVAASVTYGTGGAVNVTAAGCATAGVFSKGSPGSSRGVMVGTRGNELGRFFRGDLGEVIVYPRALHPAERTAVLGYLAAQWPQLYKYTRSQCAPSGPSSGGDTGFLTSQMYAITRYTQAVQSRNTIWPIKFNGMADIAARGSNGEPDSRGWGACNWWQNTRLPYGSMLPAGDADTFQVLMEYKLNQEKLLSNRTQLYWGHPGMWTTETSHLSGAYCPADYSCSAAVRDVTPVWLEASGYLHVDQGGDSGTGEYALMALDYLLWSSSDAANPSSAASSYLRIATQAAEFFMHHFKNRSADGRVLVWPAQVLETYWCTWNTTRQIFENCCANDSPTISGMISLFDKLVTLPPVLTTATQRADWTEFRSTLIPELPVEPSSTGGGTVIAPAEVLSTTRHNSEGPELYAIHPHRVYTKGRQIATGFDIALGERTAAESSWAHRGNGWNYGINALALIGDSENASLQLLQRAKTPPAPGYRFPGFAPHFQDFDPSADHFANMNRALQEMLIQSGDDGFTSTTIVLLPAWPCEWDVSFRLWGPLHTAVDVVYAGGKLLSLEVDPPTRRAAVKFARCISAVGV